MLSNKSYITGEDGVIRMYINIMGNVKFPGTYLVYDDIDIMTALSMGGGFLQGSNLRNIVVYHKDGSSETVNMKLFLDGKLNTENIIKLKPHDTIFIEQKLISKLLLSSNLPYIILGILNVVLTLDRTAP